MSAGWVAGSVRARALARRRLGPVRAQRLAASGSLDSALAQLAGTAYGRNVHQGLDIAAAQYEIARTVLWDLRVLAGWLPHDGVAMLRTLAAWFELANVDEMLAVRGGPAFDLGALATDWPQIRAAGAAGLRTALAASAWRDPGGDIAHAVRLGMRARYAVRVAELGNPARTWAAGAAALLVAGERLVAGRAVDPAVFGHVPRLVGASAAQAGSLAELTAGLLPRARGCWTGSARPVIYGGPSRPGEPGSSRTACGCCTAPTRT